MERLAFKMKLFPGSEKTYRKRHDEIWPELKRLLSDHGIADYSIFLDKETDTLFGVLKISDPDRLEPLSKDPIMKKWWRYMNDIMETNDDSSPVSVPLTEVFHMK